MYENWLRNMLLLLIFSGLMTPALAQNSYSEQTVAFGEDEFFPYCRGRVLKHIDGESITMMEQICEAIITWDSLNPPKGFEISFNASDRYAELTFSAYVKEDDSKTNEHRTPNVQHRMLNLVQKSQK